jgi:hypothetical protein
VVLASLRSWDAEHGILLGSFCHRDLVVATEEVDDSDPLMASCTIQHFLDIFHAIRMFLGDTVEVAKV